MNQIQIERDLSKRLTSETLKESFQDSKSFGIVLDKIESYLSVLELDQLFPDVENPIAEILTAMCLNKGKPEPLQNLALKVGFRFIKTPKEAAEAGLIVLQTLYPSKLFELTSGGQVRLSKTLIGLLNQIRGELLIRQYLPPLIERPTLRSEGGYGYHLIKTEIVTSKEHQIVGVEENYPTDVIDKLNGYSWVLSDLALALKEFNVDQDRFEFVASILEDRPFWFNHQYDFRGRIYANGYHVNYQGMPSDKATVSLNVDEKLTDEGRLALLADIGNYLGKSHSPMIERIEAAKAMLKDDHIGFDDVGEKLPLLIKSIEAYKADGGICNVRLDASASGLQLMSILAKDEQGMKYTNVTSFTYYDPYGVISDLLNEELQTEYNRSDVKKAIMTHAYNSISSPKATFGANYKTFKEAFKLVFDGVVDVMDILNSRFNKSRSVHSWVMPDGFTVHMATYRQHTSAYPFMGRKVSFMENIVSANPDQWRSLVPNIIHSVDSWVCREVIRRFDKPLGTIHDCFTVHPNHAVELKGVYNEVLNELYHSNMLEYLVAQLEQRPIEYKVEEGRRSDILNAKYSLS
jgi:hypothetical protein